MDLIGSHGRSGVAEKKHEYMKHDIRYNDVALLELLFSIEFFGIVTARTLYYGPVTGFIAYLEEFRRRKKKMAPLTDHRSKKS